ncbi:uncharacterized protein J3D65DRAFT_322908 [Phyllosticta citribraziliensis]|uniref:RRM domain-containing protein n=1 Tax=Phyllosticta citribraziliensis TaxID=989973 RepID=A0ABR1LUH1_9PEZI
MGPHRKKQRLSEDGKAIAAVATDDSPEISTKSTPTDQKQKQAEQKLADDPNAVKHRRQLFIRGLPATVTSEILTELFSQSYPIKHAVAVLDKESKQCKGYGFVTFADAEDAQRASEEFDGSEVEGRKIRVEVAEHRHRDPQTGAATPSKEGKKHQAQDPLKSQSKLIVRNLPWSIKKEEQLTKLFLSYGKIKNVSLPKKASGMLAGYGFVTLRGRKNAEKALEAINGKEIDGRTLAVDWAVDKDTWQKVQKDAQEEEAETDEAADDSDKEAASGEEEDEDEVSSDVDEDEDEDEEDEGLDEEFDEVEEEAPRHQRDSNHTTLFVRNLPFTCVDEDLVEHFEQFGAVRYARIVIDRDTEKPKGTGFVCFYNEEDAINCLKAAPRNPLGMASKEKPGPAVAQSVLQNEDADPTGKYTMDGRVLNITQAVDRTQAERFTAEGVEHRYKRDKDKRRLYLLSEGTIATNSPMYNLLPPAEVKLREDSTKQRKKLIESNPSLHMSLTRLSIRNIPRTITSKDLKQLARKAVVGFSTDMKEGKRQPLSKEELVRDGQEQKEAEKLRKSRGKGIVRQAKIVFEDKQGSKVNEYSGAGRSRGYGFIEYYTHRNALMGLRWLNCHEVDYTAIESSKGKKLSPEDVKERKKRLIVEFAIENAQVVQRRKEMEEKMYERSQKKAEQKDEEGDSRSKRKDGKGKKGGFKKGDKDSRKRKRAGDDDGASKKSEESASKDEKLAKASRIIARKRQLRRARNKGKA